MLEYSIVLYDAAHFMHRQSPMLPHPQYIYYYLSQVPRYLTAQPFMSNPVGLASSGARTYYAALRPAMLVYRYRLQDAKKLGSSELGLGTNSETSAFSISSCICIFYDYRGESVNEQCVDIPHHYRTVASFIYTFTHIVPLDLSQAYVIVS